LKFNEIDGDYAEFGSHGGMTFSLAYHESRSAGYPCRLWAFDSFRGLPTPKTPEDRHPKWIEGRFVTGIADFHRICRDNGLPRSSYEIVPGYYDETLSMSNPNIKLRNICMAYVDCDLYSSTTSVLRFILPRLKHGMIIAFDDYFCWSSTQLSGERRAHNQILESNEEWRFVPYIQFGVFGLSFAVENKKLDYQELEERHLVV